MGNHLEVLFIRQLRSGEVVHPGSPGGPTFGDLRCRITACNAQLRSRTRSSNCLSYSYAQRLAIVYPTLGVPQTPLFEQIVDPVVSLDVVRQHHVEGGEEVAVLLRGPVLR